VRVEAPDERPIARRDGVPVRWLVLGWIAAFVVPLTFQLLLKAKHLVPDDTGSSCSALSPADQREFDHAVLPLQITLVLWALAGAAVVTYAWLRALPDVAATRVVLGGWLLGVVGELVVAWIGPATNDLVKVFAFVFAVALLVVGGLLMGVALVWRRARRKSPIPVAVLLGALAQIAVVVLAGTFLGGTGEVPLC
jgi:hypothetical protein